ncbi:MAG TPA: sulfatase [Bryobacteraceae bacterium]|nr:sulfatase [Bryobacteraceae bacterium]
MTRRSLLAGAAAPLLAQGAKKRNLVFILCDDHRFDMMGFRGHPWLKTPNLDRLAKGGALIENAFVTTALCSPSRASILTGQYVHAHGVTDNVSPLPANLTTFPQVLQKHGYKTALIGKWHMGGDSDMPRPGFDRWVSFRGQGKYVDPDINYDGKTRTVKGYVTDILTEEAKRFIQENEKGPFLLYLSHKAVHADFTPADRHKDLYKTEPIPYPATMANTDENYKGKPEWLRRQRNSWHGVDGMYNHRIKFDDFYRDYCRTLMALDDSVGAVMDELKSKNLLNDTLFIYMGDNGFQFGEHGLIDKRTMYEPSMRVPMIAHCPDLFPGGKRVEQMVLNLDIGPTLLEAAGAPIPSTVHGRSFLPLLTGKPVNWRTEFIYEYFWERDYPQTPTVIGLRTDQYSFMQYHGIWDLDELYDVRKDPQQRTNLLADVRTTTESGRLFGRIKDPEKKKLVADLQKRTKAILDATGGLPEPTWRTR